MTGIHQTRSFVLVGLILTLLFTTAYAQQTTKKEYVFHGKVEKIDIKAKTITIDGQKVVGWMDAMMMSYGVDKDDILKTLKVGDEITAKVYEGDFKILHDIKVVPAKSAAPPTKK